MMLIFIIFVAIVFYFNSNKHKVTLPLVKNAEDLLTERYIKGEIDEKTFLHMKETVRS